jgi:glucarate dehydratase
MTGDVTLNHSEAIMMSSITRRSWISHAAAGLSLLAIRPSWAAQANSSNGNELIIKDLRVTPIALPDPPLLAASGCHGPYFLRNIVELETDAGITGIGETHGGSNITSQLEQCRELCVGQNAFAYRKFAPAIKDDFGGSTYAAIELACLDAIGHATGRRACEMLGGPVREKVEFASYLFFRYAADHPQVLNDPRLVDSRGRGDQALDPWGEVRTPESMAELAWDFHKKFGFRVHKLKAGVFDPQMELEALRAINDRFKGEHPLRIDPNSRWTVPTALRIGEALKDMPLEYYEDPGCDPKQAHRCGTWRPSWLGWNHSVSSAGNDHRNTWMGIEPAQQQSCWHHHGGHDPCGRSRPAANHRQRYSLRLAGRRGGYHRRQ